MAILRKLPASFPVAYLSVVIEIHGSRVTSLFILSCLPALLHAEFMTQHKSESECKGLPLLILLLLILRLLLPGVRP